LSLEPLEDRTVLSGTTAGASPLLPAYGQIPLSFEANQGQAAPRFDYLSHGQGYTLLLTPSEAVLALRQGSGARHQGLAEDVLQMRLVGANPAAQVIGLDQQAGVSNYFPGNDPSRWLTNVPHCGRVEYQDLYPGIDLVYYGNQSQLEYDFVVAPGANPGVIQLAFRGARLVTLDSEGDLVLHTAGGDVVEHAPVIYQESGGVRHDVAGRYVLEANGRVGFQVGAYDRGQDLVIDPVLSYSSYLGGSNGDFGGASIAVDGAGDAFVTGWAGSTFPTTAGAFQTTDVGGNLEEAFVARFAPSPCFVVSGFPSPTTAGVAGAFTVTALNANGTVNAGYTGTVHFSSSDPPALLPVNYTFTAADQGVHTFTATLETAGSQSITATDTATGNISGSESGMVVNPAAAAKLVLGAPPSVTRGSKFSLTLTVEDAYGNVVTGYRGTVHFSSSDGTATLPSNHAFTASDSGVHTFTGLVLRKKGKQTITVTDTQDGTLTATDTINVG
jgi:hypothetical protein